MAYWTEYNYVTVLGKDTPMSVIDILRYAHLKSIKPKIDLDDCPDFLKKFGVDYLNRFEASDGYGYCEYRHLLVLHGVYKFQDYDVEFQDFLKWINPYVIMDEFKGWLHYRDGDNLPRLIHNSNLVSLKEIIKNEERYF
jgi:hypothetical protein